MRAEAFNGDADGLCALRQWREHHGKAEISISGVKRDIALLRKLDCVPEHLVVLDVSHKVNQKAVSELLTAGCAITYIDHHNPGPLPKAAHFKADIQCDPHICTAIIMQQHLNFQRCDWAISGAFGDNLHRSAHALGQAYSHEQMADLQQFGELLNYNGYGLRIEDLHVAPWRLADELDHFALAQQCLRESPLLAQIEQGYRADFALAQQQQPLEHAPRSLVYLLPDAAWARRSMGSLANHRVNANPDHAVAVAVPNGDGKTMTISIRAAQTRPSGAGDFAEGFAHGGGRAAAAGINQFDDAEFAAFIERFHTYFAEY